MMEELTPQILSVLLFIVVIAVPILTLMLSALMLWRYRRAVIREMAITGGFDVPAPHAPGSSKAANPAVRDLYAHGRDLCRRAIRGPWHLAIRYTVAGLTFALVFALAWRFVFAYRLGVPGFLLSVWIYAWPAVLALLLIVPGSTRLRTSCVAGYFVMLLLLGLWASSITDIPALKFGGTVLPARSSVTPVGMMKIWLVANGIPTVLILLCFDRRVRAVAPLVLGFMTTAISGTLVVWFALFTHRGIDAAVALSVSLDLHVVWLVVATLALSLAGFGGIGWALARWIARAYRRKTLSDQSLMMDALWLFFASFYTMWLVWGGLGWAATAPAAFLAYKLVSAAGRRIPGREPHPARGLTFLRVFSLGERSEALLDTVARYWRHIGSVQTITGPDVAGSTVQPHQFLDFLSRKLPSHFVRDPASLERSMAEWDRAADPDGRFRVNNFFCQADSWQRALQRLVQEGDAVLMDLRSFSAMNAGCIFELQHLVKDVPLSRCLLIVDDTTDEAFLEHTLKDAWERLPPESPNHTRSPEAAPLHRFGSGIPALRRVVRQLCDAAGI